MPMRHMWQPWHGSSEQEGIVVSGLAAIESLKTAI